MVNSGTVNNCMSSVETPPLNSAPWMKELIKSKFAGKWLKESFGQVDDPFLQLKMLEEELTGICGRKVALLREGADSTPATDKPSYSEVVKRNSGEVGEVGDFEKHTKGIGRKIMVRQGWNGEGLGNGRKQGMKHAIEAKGQVASCKHGVGYKEEEEDGEEDDDGEWKERKWVRSGTRAKGQVLRVDERELVTSNRFSPLSDEFREGSDEVEKEEEKEAKEEEEDKDECLMFKRKRSETKGEAKRRRKAQKQEEEVSGSEEEIQKESDDSEESSDETVIKQRNSSCDGGRTEAPSGYAHTAVDAGNEQKYTILNPVLKPTAAVRSKERANEHKAARAVVTNTDGRAAKAGVTDISNKEESLVGKEKVSKIMTHSETQAFTSPFKHIDETEGSPMDVELAVPLSSAHGSADGLAFSVGLRPEAPIFEPAKGKEKTEDENLGISKEDTPRHMAVQTNEVNGKGAEKRVSFAEEKEVQSNTLGKEKNKMKCCKNTGETKLERLPVIKGQEDNYDEWNKWKTHRRKPYTNTKQQIICNSCMSPTCEALARIKLVAPVEDTKQEEAQLSGQGATRMDNVMECSSWLPMDDDARIREKPVIDSPDEVDGAKHRIVGIINDKFIVYLLDTGSFSSIISKSKALELGLTLEPLETPICARSATGGLQLTHEVHAMVDFGSVKCAIRMLVIDSPRWKSQMILLGSSS